MNADETVMLGWASCDITPEQPVLIVGQFHARISTGILDPITATALAVGDDDCESQAILVSCDLLWIDDAILADVRDELGKRIPGFNPMNLLAGATHIHTGPVMEDGAYPPAPEGVMTGLEYRAFLSAKIVELAESAWKNRKPGRLSRAFNYAVVGHNRRSVYHDGSAVMYGPCNRDDFAGLEGFEDHGLDMLFAWDENSNLTGIVANIACTAQVDEGLCQITADFWHETRLELKKAFSDDIFVLPQCSAAGDLSPHPMTHKTREMDMLKRMGITLREAIARRITSAVQEVFETARDNILVSRPIKHVARTIELPMKKVTDEELTLAKSEVARLDKALETWIDHTIHDSNRSGEWLRRVWYKGVLKRAEQSERGETVKMELNVLRIGDIAFCTSPFELYLDYGLCIKSRSPAVQTFVLQLACGKGGWGGYLPTARALRGKSYSAIAPSCAVGPEGGWKLVEETLATLNSMW